MLGSVSGWWCQEMSGTSIESANLVDCGLDAELLAEVENLVRQFLRSLLLRHAGPHRRAGLTHRDVPTARGCRHKEHLTASNRGG
jgi:hypothetical protein